jgi:hypothetical protein
MHYNNPSGLPGFKDSSGMRITLTKQLRQHDMGFMSLGNILLSIPPGEKHFTTPAMACPGRLEGPGDDTAESL